MATMQFELLSASHAILQHAVEEACVVPTPAEPLPPSGQAWVLALPFSSLRLNSSLARYLDLTPEQSSALWQVMTQERPKLEPLMAQLDATRQKLDLATRNDHPDQKQIRTLARTQAQLLTKLIAEDSELQSKILRLLNAEQRRKIERLRQDSELSALTVE
jgi:Spy/CpxP family protein refolding chaperone